MRVKLALSTLCENPARRTGLSTFFPEFLAAARKAFPEVGWIVFCGEGARWPDTDPGVEWCRSFPSNERPVGRLLADHLGVAPEARRRGARALVTVGFHPLRSAGLPVAMHVLALPGGPGEGGARSAYRRWALARGLRRSSLVIANSEWTRSQLGPSRAPLIASPEGVSHALFGPDGARGLPGIDGPYLLWASNFYAYKHAERALAAYARLPESLRGRFPLVLAGGDWSGGRARAELAARRLGLGDQARFLGWVDDSLLPALYRGAHAHILSTERETFGRSVLEAMACGTPSVVQDLPVLREVAADCAVYADYADTAGASAALESLCVDPAQRERLSAAGVTRSRLFSFERLARERVGAILEGLGAGNA